MRKTIGITLLAGYVAVLSVFAAAEYFYQTGKAAQACQLNPFVSDYRYKLFQQTGSLQDIQAAIALEPLKPAYHMYYGLELLKDYKKRTRISDEIAFNEIKRAYELKPYSKLYRETYENIRRR